MALVQLPKGETVGCHRTDIHCLWKQLYSVIILETAFLPSWLSGNFFSINFWNFLFHSICFWEKSSSLLMKKVLFKTQSLFLNCHDIDLKQWKLCAILFMFAVIDFVSTNLISVFSTEVFTRWSSKKAHHCQMIKS